MFAGKPIVASSILPNRESVEHNQTALLVPVQDTEGLAEAMLKMLDRPEDAARFGTRAREEALRRFDIRRIAEQHEELYRRVIEEHHR
jgi:glycosyltransferase involved in cell wall biosynthesis